PACASPRALLRAALSDLDDRAVEHRRGLSHADHALLLELVDLVVSDDQHGRRTRLPAHDLLTPERRVRLLPRLGAEDRELPGRRRAAEEIDLLARLERGAELGGAVDVLHRRLRAARRVGGEERVLVPVVVTLERRDAAPILLTIHPGW